MKIFDVIFKRFALLKLIIFIVFCLSVSGLEDEEDLSCPPDLEEVSQKCDVPGMVFITRLCNFCPSIFLNNIKKCGFLGF